MAEANNFFNFVNINNALEKYGFISYQQKTCKERKRPCLVAYNFLVVSEADEHHSHEIKDCTKRGAVFFISLILKILIITNNNPNEFR